MCLCFPLLNLGLLFFACCNCFLMRDSSLLLFFKLWWAKTGPGRPHNGLKNNRRRAWINAPLCIGSTQIRPHSLFKLVKRIDGLRFAASGRDVEIAQPVADAVFAATAVPGVPLQPHVALPTGGRLHLRRLGGNALQAEAPWSRRAPR